jgi:hypothetical protein
MNDAARCADGTRETFAPALQEELSMLKRGSILFAMLALLLLLAWPASAAATTTCRMNFDLRGWSLGLKEAAGTGTVTCDNGQIADVKITAKGAGLTAGRYAIRDGSGKFSEVSDIGEVFGRYAAADVSAGVHKEGAALAMTKGSVSLALAGKGTGFDLGVALEKFTIRPAHQPVRRGEDRR